MQIIFDTKMFDGCPKSLTNVLHHLCSRRCISPAHIADLEQITCRTPSEALRYCRLFVGNKGISPASEVVFLKNPGLAIRYLKLVRRKYFIDEKTQKRFWKKLLFRPNLAYDYCVAFNTRLKENEEEIFVKDMRSASQYAQQVIKGPFPEKVHQMIVLLSFDTAMSEWQRRYLKDYINFAEKFKKNEFAKNK